MSKKSSVLLQIAPERRSVLMGPIRVSEPSWTRSGSAGLLATELSL